MFPAFAWGVYLDEWGVTVAVERKEAVQATGEVTFTGLNGTLIATGTQVSPPQTDPDVAPPIFETTGSGSIGVGGTIILPIRAVEPGSGANVASGTITLLVSPVAGVTALTNVAATSGGAEVETDEAYRERILLEIAQPAGAGNQADYQRWALAYPGVGHATVQALWNGAGTVRVIVTDPDNNPVSPTVVAGLQADLDPVAQQGAGRAPIGALVTVAAPTSLTVNISATVTFKTGYSLDGTAGTVPTRSVIVTAIKQYIDNLGPDDDVIFNHVEARFFAVEGVFDVSSLLLNGVATNVGVASLQVAETGTVTLT